MPVRLRRLVTRHHQRRPPKRARSVVQRFVTSIDFSLITRVRNLKHNGNRLFRQTSITATAFKSKATPLHINITHTAPPEATEGEAKDEKETSDPGHVASATLLPSVFSTGSYGWKGSKRVSIEVEKEDGENETVQVMIRCVLFDGDFRGTWR